MTGFASHRILSDNLLFKGDVDRPEDLPADGNNLGDFYRVKDSPAYEKPIMVLAWILLG
jgi:hypothetical protein